MKRKTNKRKHLVLLLVLSMLIANILCACGSSNEVAATSAKEETTTVKEETQPEVAEAEEAAPAEESEAVEETETEAEDIENPEPVEYEGIDLNSSLPTPEWVEQSFPGVIDEYKLVVYNDETHYRVIVENGQTIKFHKDDKLLTYFPMDEDIVGGDRAFLESSDDFIIASDNSFSIYIDYNVEKEIWDEGKKDIEVITTDGTEEKTLTATFVFVD